MKFSTFNVENLFTRPKAMNLSKVDLGTEKLAIIADLQDELAQSSYDKPKIANLANQVRGYFSINKTRGRTPLSWDKSIESYKVTVNGRDSWDGFIELKRDNFDFATVKNTGRFMRKIDADVFGICEIENISAMRKFRSNQLSRMDLDYELLVDGNDSRGIDIGIYSRFPIGCFEQTFITNQATERVELSLVIASKWRFYFLLGIPCGFCKII